MPIAVYITLCLDTLSLFRWILTEINNSECIINVAYTHKDIVANICGLEGRFHQQQKKCHDDVIKWKHFPHYWPFVRGIHRSPVHTPHKGQWRGALIFSLICAQLNVWVNNREAGDLRRYRTHYDVNVRAVGNLYHYIRYTFWIYMQMYNTATRGCFYWNGLILIPAWINNHMPGTVWAEITNPFANSSGATVLSFEMFKWFHPTLYNGCN